jgi:hypothetical protein
LFSELTNKEPQSLSEDKILENSEIESSNEEQQSFEEEIGETSNIVYQPTEINTFDFSKILEDWGLFFVHGLMYRLLKKISNFCINESFTMLSSSADVFIILNTLVQNYALSVQGFSCYTF